MWDNACHIRESLQKDAKMADTNYEGWTRFYSEFADVLRGYKNRQGEIVAGIKRAFEAQGVRLPRLDNGELTEIDPFTVFGLFNKGITDDTRCKIITGLKEEFGVGAPVPDAFDGVPEDRIKLKLASMRFN